MLRYPIERTTASGVEEVYSQICGNINSSNFGDAIFSFSPPKPANIVHQSLQRSPDGVYREGFIVFSYETIRHQVNTLPVVMPASDIPSDAGRVFARVKDSLTKDYTYFNCMVYISDLAGRTAITIHTNSYEVIDMYLQPKAMVKMLPHDIDYD